MPETQARSSWSPPTGTLGELIRAAEVRALRLESEARAWRERAESAPRPASFRDALLGGTVAVIAEVKRRSPSRGSINPDIDAVSQAAAYQAGGAAAISVLTEPDRFGGSDDDLVRIAAAVSIPLLKKDFHVSAAQLCQARALGASAALLIARALEPVRLEELVNVAAEIGLEALVEVRSETELETALSTGANLIGINNRNLETLEIDAATVGRLMRLVPAAVAAVAESGMAERADVERAGRAGADAVLVGSAISASGDPAAAVRALCGVAADRSPRVGLTGGSGSRARSD